MELVLLYIAAFLRPLFFIDATGETTLDDASAAMELFNWFAVALFLMLAAALLSSMSVRKRLHISAIDLWMAAFGVWCIVIYVIYIDKGNAREVIKLLFPIFTYFVVKNILPSEQHYVRMLFLMIVAFLIPVIWSAGVTLVGGGVEIVNYWTQVPRYKGVYTSSHLMAHNMTFLLMVLFLYAYLAKGKEAQSSFGFGKVRLRFLCVVLAIPALYCLTMSQVRNTMLGLLAFLAYYLLVFNRRMLVIGLLVGGSVTVVTAPMWVDVLLYDFAKVSEGEWKSEEIGSGRTRIWKHNLSLFADMPLDRQLAGVGIGNKVAFGSKEGVMDSHNDYLDVMMQTGIVGLILYLGIQIALIAATLKIPGREKHIFLAMYLAVAIMNVASNSYITRSGMAQLFYLVVAYVELRRKQESEETTEVIPGRVWNSGHYKRG